MGPNCAPLVADLFLFCYERDFMLSLSDNNQADIIEAFNSTSRYLDDLLNIDNPYFEQMVGQIYPTELQLKTNAAISSARISRVWKRVMMSGSCLSTINGFGSTHFPIFLCHIGVPTFS